MLKKSFLGVEKLLRKIHCWWRCDSLSYPPFFFSNSFDRVAGWDDVNFRREDFSDSGRGGRGVRSEGRGVGVCVCGWSVLDMSGKVHENCITKS